MIILNIMLSYVINVIFLESILILVKKLSSNYFDKNSYVQGAYEKFSLIELDIHAVYNYAASTYNWQWNGNFVSFQDLYDLKSCGH